MDAPKLPATEDSLKLIAAAGDAIEKTSKALPVYQDALQPSMQEIGKQAARAIRTAGEAVNAALMPTRLIVWGFDQIEASLKASLEKKFKDVPSEKILQNPAPNIVGPAIEGLKFTAQESHLREMFENLIANSLHVDWSKSTHPSFVEIIKQLSVSEAAFINLVAKETLFTFPMVDLESHDKFGKQYQFVRQNFFYFEYDNEKYSVVEKISAENLENLMRLKIFERLEMGMSFTDAYEKILELEVVKEIRANIEAQGRSFEMERKTLRLTKYGVAFITACVDAEYNTRFIKKHFQDE